MSFDMVMYDAVFNLPFCFLHFGFLTFGPNMHKRYLEEGLEFSRFNNPQLPLFFSHQALCLQTASTHPASFGLFFGLLKNI